MSKGIFYIHNNTPVIAAERKPKLEEFAKKKYSSTVNIAEYLKAIREWESQLIPAENVYSIDNENRVMLTIGEFTKKVTPGDAIEYEGNVITKIL